MSSTMTAAVSNYRVNSSIHSALCHSQSLCLCIALHECPRSDDDNALSFIHSALMALNYLRMLLRIFDLKFGFN